MGGRGDNLSRDGSGVAATGRSRRWLTAAGIAAATIFGVFVLPFGFPPKHPSFSASYSAGFNNRVAVAAAVLMALVTFAVAWRERPGPAYVVRGERGRIPGRYLAAAMIACAAFTLGMGWMMTKAALAYNDNLYFLEYMDEVTTYHLHIYKDFSFLYGPLLLYFPVAVQMLLRPFHVGLQVSYYVALCLMQLLGIVLLYYTLEALPLSRRSKTITLGVFTLGVLCPLLGLNYTLVRSLLPFSALLLVTRMKRPWAVAGTFFLAELLQLAVSPELGVAFAAGACFYSLCRAVTTSRAYLGALAATPLAALAFLGMTGKIYLASISRFSAGSLNLIVEPLPYLLVFLLALVWLVPRMLGRMLKEGAPDAITMLSLFVLSVALVPAAFGRCDPLHVFFNGAGIYLLSAVAISAYAEEMGNVWLFVLALTLVWTQAVNFSVYKVAILYAAKVDFRPAPERQTTWFANFVAVERLVHSGRVSTPFYVPLSAEEELKGTGLYQPDRECFYIGIWDAESETARAMRMDETEWAIVSSHAVLTYETAETARRIVGLGFLYPDRRRPYAYGSLLLKDLETNWTPTSRNADWILYHNKRFASPGGSR